MKEFLKPTILKIILTIMFLVLSDRVFGFPLKFYREASFGLKSLSVINIIIDLVFWYIIFCLIIYSFKKYKKNN